MRWTPESLAAAAHGRLLRRGSRPIAAAFIDSRRAREDALFVPLTAPVAARDGHAYLSAAVEGGASATLLALGRPPPEGDLTIVEVEDTFVALTTLARDARAQIEGPVVAITGSNGKTTTRAYIEAAMGTRFERVLCTQGNLNNHLGLPLTLVDGPEIPDAAVLELGMSAPGENDHLASVARPSVHVITSIALEHLEFMGTLEAIAAAEAEPIAHLRAGPGADGAPRRPLLVVPGDEPSLVPHLPGPERGVTVLRFGRADAAVGGPLDVEIEAVSVGERTWARLRVGEQRVEIRVRAFGAHNARNAAAALAVAMHLGIPLPAVVEALAQVEPVGDRGRLRAWGPHALIADCYNANPGSMVAALDSLALLREARSGPLIAVLGDMLELGPNTLLLHAALGVHAADLGLDGVLGVGPLGAVIAEAARARGVAAVACEVEAVAEAASWVRGRLDPGHPGAVLFKASRGVRLERVLEALTSMTP